MLYHNEIVRDQLAWFRRVHAKYGNLVTMLRIPGIGNYVLSSHPNDVDYVLAGASGVKQALIP